MIEPKRIIPVLILLAFLSISCRLVSEMVSVEQDQETQPAPAIEIAETHAFPTEDGEQPTRAAELPDDTQANATQAEPSPAGEVPLEGGYPPQTTAAAIQPLELRAKLTRLSNWIGFRVVDYFGAPMGVVADYVVNTCETYIIYFLVDPLDSFKPEQGRFVVIPLEAVTINNGVLDAASQTIQVHMAADPMSGAPAFPEGIPLTPTDWEEGVRNYWSQYFRLSGLKTECLVAQSGADGDTMAVYKVAYATHLIGAPLQDGLGNPLGAVVEAILEPESGKLGFFVVQLQNGELVMVHLSAVNIPEWALEPGAQTTLVLLKENNVLANAPRIQDIEVATEAAAQQTAREYWTR